MFFILLNKRKFIKQKSLQELNLFSVIVAKKDKKLLVSDIIELTF